MKNWQRIRQNPQLLDTFLMREKVIDGIREFFKSDDFHEVETPLMVRYPGTEPFLEVFETEMKVSGGSNSEDGLSKDKIKLRTERAFLLTSPEFAMKKLLAAGLPKIFQVCKSFRNSEGLSSRHNPEFTILEWYRTKADYQDIMRDCEELVRFLVKKVSGQDEKLVYQGREFDIAGDWMRISVAEAFRKWVGLSATEMLDREVVVKRAQEEGYSVDGETTWEEAYNQLFLNLIEPRVAEIDCPVIIYDYPLSQAAYSRPKKEDPRFAERFEFYIGGLELGNAFSELLDPDMQEAKFKEDLVLRAKLGKTDYGMDKDYIKALRSGVPQTGGIAVGVDRLVMLLANAKSIKDTMWFPVEEVW